MNSNLTIIAWVGEDESGSGQVGIKRVIVDGRYDILALVEGQGDVMAKLTQSAIVDALQQSANRYGKRITLMRFEGVEPLTFIEPER